MNHNPSRRAVPAHRAGLEQRLSAIGRLIDRNRRELLGFAKERLRLRNIPDVEYTDEDALQSGTRTFLEDIVAGKIDRFDDEVGALRILRRIIADKVSAGAHRCEQSNVIVPESGAGWAESSLSCQLGIARPTIRRRVLGTKSTSIN